MIRIPAGPALVGNRTEPAEAYSLREVDFAEFWIDRHEVTCSQWRHYAQQADAACPWGEDDQYQVAWNSLPVVGLSWLEAEGYANFQGKRLPTWSEWQKAARGPEGLEFPWGNTWGDSVDQSAVVNRRIVIDGVSQALPWFEGLANVGTTLGDQSYYGAMDTLGNALEWTSSSFVHSGEDGLVINHAAKVISGLGWKDSIESIATDVPGRRRLDMCLFGPLEWRGPGFRCAVSLSLNEGN
ncbi:MAG: formylglycine-generating enzyme family protein [Planctomycetota bacterium]